MLVERVGNHVRVEITLDAASEHNVWCNLSLDIEQGGIFVATHQPLRLGTVVAISARLPEDDEPVVMSGIVRWTREYVEGSESPGGVGIKFISLESGVRDALGRFAERVREPLLFDLEDEPIRRRPGSSSPVRPVA